MRFSFFGKPEKQAVSQSSTPTPVVKRETTDNPLVSPHAQTMFLLENEPKLRNAKNLVDFFRILDSGKLYKLPYKISFEGESSLEVDILASAIDKYLERLAGRVPTQKGEFFFDIFRMGEVNVIDKEFRKSLNDLILKEAVERSRKQLNPMEEEMQGMGSQLRRAETFEDFFTILKSGSLKRIPFTDGSSIKIETLEEAARHYKESLGKRVPAQGDKLFFDVVGIGEVSVLGQEFKDILNQLIIKEAQQEAEARVINAEKENTSSYISQNNDVSPVVTNGEVTPRDTFTSQKLLNENEILEAEPMPILHDESARGPLAQKVLQVGAEDISYRTVHTDTGTSTPTPSPNRNITASDDISPTAWENTQPPEDISFERVGNDARNVENYTESKQRGALRPATSRNNRFINGMRALQEKAEVTLEEAEGAIERGLRGVLRSPFVRKTGRLLGINPAIKMSPEKAEQTQHVTEPSPEEMTRVGDGLKGVYKRTGNLFREAVTGADEPRRKLLASVEKFSNRFNKLPKSVRYGAGIAIAGLGATGASIIVPPLALATVVAGVGGAGIGVTLHRALELRLAQQEEPKNKDVGTLRKQLMDAGVVTASVFATAAVAFYLQSLSPKDTEGPTTEQEITHVIKQASTPASAITSTMVADMEKKSTDSINQAYKTQTLEEVPASPAKKIVYTVQEGEDLWKIVKEYLAQDETFTSLSEQKKNLEISKYLAAIEEAKIFKDIDVIHTGDKVDFSKIDVRQDILKHVNPFAH